MRKILLVTISILGLAILIFIATRIVYFRETQGKVIDEQGNPIPNATVIVSYNCKTLGLVQGGGLEPIHRRVMLTSQEGDYRTGSYLGFMLSDIKPFASEILFRPCQKAITAYKSGYCGLRIGIDSLSFENCIDALLQKKEIGNIGNAGKLSLLRGELLQIWR